MPPTSPMGPSARTSCVEHHLRRCHLGSLANVSGLIRPAPRTAPGTLFATPLPTSSQIHSGVTSGCAGCHETNYVDGHQLLPDLADRP